MGDGERDEGTYVGDSAREVVDIASISDIDGAVVFAGDSSLCLFGLRGRCSTSVLHFCSRFHRR